ncbi:VIT1/CCC1 transporter family protein [Alicyclobacillus ferrooxydans]|uniref:Iron transporter n=1 Tax=Alicyclobacillus ferrooxydans TaxID=471514 RepID=A0A0P9ETP7_9BACL|nr:VIT1/CCC1 transporter family protein [Alicyclobacillus ferrooxydans]KPV42239.1 iron transporter [Alicyclobacillus ferrooxydans]
MAMQKAKRKWWTPERIRDIVIGMSDGLTVPFALAAGLTGAVSTSKLIVTAGLAEIAAGSIAMGLGGFLAVRSDHEYYLSTREDEHRSVREIPEEERDEVRQLVEEWGVDEAHLPMVVESITRDHEQWVNFMLRHEFGLEAPRPGRALSSSVTIGGSYIVGGLIPLLPYFFIHHPLRGLWASVILTGLALFIFGIIKSRLTRTRPFRGGVSMAAIGGCAAAVAFLAARFIS